MQNRTAADNMVVGMVVDSMVVGMVVDSMVVAGMGTDGMVGNTLDSVHNSLVVGRVGQMYRVSVVDQGGVGAVVDRGVKGGMVDRGVEGLVRQINLSGSRLVLLVF